MESSWIHCEPMRDQEKSHCQCREKQGNHTRKTKPTAVRCGRLCKRCFPMSESSGWLTCSSTAASNPGRFCVSVRGSGVMYVKFIESGAISWSDYCTMRINCDGD